MIKLLKLIPFTENLKCVVASKNGKGFIADLNSIYKHLKKKENNYLI